MLENENGAHDINTIDIGQSSERQRRLEAERKRIDDLVAWSPQSDHSMSPGRRNMDDILEKVQLGRLVACSNPGCILVGHYFDDLSLSCVFL